MVRKIFTQEQVGIMAENSYTLHVSINRSHLQTYSRKNFDGDIRKGIHLERSCTIWV